MKESPTNSRPSIPLPPPWPQSSIPSPPIIPHYPFLSSLDLNHLNHRHSISLTNYPVPNPLLRMTTLPGHSFCSPFLFLFALFRLCLSAHLPPSQPRWQCPNNGTYFDATPCDPNATFSCPALYKCRMAVESDGQEGIIAEMKAGKRVQWICCENGEMGIREWLLELGLAPAIFPKVPKSTLRRVFLRDEQSGKVVAVDGNGADISLLPFDSSESANYSRLEGIEFGEEVPRNGGFLHILVAINQLSSPSALQLYFDYSSFGIAQIDLGAQNDRFPRGYAQAIGIGFVPAALAYRRQNVVTVFHTDAPMANASKEIDRTIADSDGKLQTALFGNNGTNMAKLLGVEPIAGFIYTISTRASIFALTYDQQWKDGDEDGRPMPSPAGAELGTTNGHPRATGAKGLALYQQLGHNTNAILPLTTEAQTTSAGTRLTVPSLATLIVCIAFFYGGRELHKIWTFTRKEV